MALSPVPFVVKTSGASGSAPKSAVPIALYGVAGGAADWNTITNKPATFAPTIGTTATTAKAGNYTPTTTEVGNALKAKAQITALANGVNAAAAPTQAEFNALVTVVNAIIAALKA